MTAGMRMQTMRPKRLRLIISLNKKMARISPRNAAAVVAAVRAGPIRLMQLRPLGQRLRLAGMRLINPVSLLQPIKTRQPKLKKNQNARAAVVAANPNSPMMRRQKHLLMQIRVWLKLALLSNLLKPPTAPKHLRPQRKRRPNRVVVPRAKRL